MNDFGKIFKVTIYGTSHNDCFGCLIDNVPAGISLSASDFSLSLERRRPKSLYETARHEADLPIIKSGLFLGKTNGTPLVIEFKNEDKRSNDYINFNDTPRPSHADFSAKVKYNGFNDYRGGGAFSGRLTSAIVCAGDVAKKIANFDYHSEIIKVGGLQDLNKKDDYLNEVAMANDSVGGIIRVTVKNVPIGLGEPYFYSVESAISQILYSIGAVKGVSFGVGFDGVDLRGSEFNDVIIDRFGHTKTNNNGGINGGISNGNDLVINIFVKPIASIGKKQETYDFKNNKISELEIKGRHDSSIIDRVMVVLESAIAISLADLVLINKALH